MSKKDKNKTAIIPLSENMPEHLRGRKEIKGLETARQFIRPPRIKVVDDSSSDDLKSEFGVGTILVVQGRGYPPHVLTSPTYGDKGQPEPENAPPVRFIPILMFREFCTWNPAGMKPAIRFRTINIKHPVAAKAQNPDTRKEICPENPDKTITHVEHLVFVVQLLDVPEFKGKPCLLSFSRGNHFAGREFCTLITGCRADIFARVYELVPGFRDKINADYTWWGIDVRNPSSGDPWVPATDFGVFEQIHDELNEAHRENLIVADYDDHEDEPRTVHSAAAPAGATAPPM